MTDIEKKEKPRPHLQSTQIFARNLKFLLTRNQMTAKQLAPHIGISEQSISGWMTCTRNPHASTIEKVAEFFNVPASAFSDPLGNAGLVPNQNLTVNVPMESDPSGSVTFVPSDNKVIPTQAFIATDNDMSPIINKDDTVMYITSNNPVHRNSVLVVVSCPDSRPIVRRLFLQNDTAILSANDPSVPPIVCTVDEYNSRYLGKPLFIQRRIMDA